MEDRKSNVSKVPKLPRIYKNIALRQRRDVRGNTSQVPTPFQMTQPAARSLSSPLVSSNTNTKLILTSSTTSGGGIKSPFVSSSSSDISGIRSAKISLRNKEEPEQVKRRRSLGLKDSSTTTNIDAVKTEAEEGVVQKTSSVNERKKLFSNSIRSRETKQTTTTLASSTRPRAEVMEEDAKKNSGGGNDKVARKQVAKVSTKVRSITQQQEQKRVEQKVERTEKKKKKKAVDQPKDEKRKRSTRTSATTTTTRSGRNQQQQSSLLAAEGSNGVSFLCHDVLVLIIQFVTNAYYDPYSLLNLGVVSKQFRVAVDDMLSTCNEDCFITPLLYGIDKQLAAKIAFVSCVFVNTSQCRTAHKKSLVRQRIMYRICKKHREQLLKEFLAVEGGPQIDAMDHDELLRFYPKGGEAATTVDKLWNADHTVLTYQPPEVAVTFGEKRFKKYAKVGPGLGPRELQETDKDVEDNIPEEAKKADDADDADDDGEVVYVKTVKGRKTAQMKQDDGGDAAKVMPREYDKNEPDPAGVRGVTFKGKKKELEDNMYQEADNEEVVIEGFDTNAGDAADAEAARDDDPSDASDVSGETPPQEDLDERGKWYDSDDGFDSDEDGWDFGDEGYIDHHEDLSHDDDSNADDDDGGDDDAHGGDEVPMKEYFGHNLLPSSDDEIDAVPSNAAQNKVTFPSAAAAKSKVMFTVLEKSTTTTTAGGPTNVDSQLPLASSNLWLDPNPTNWEKWQLASTFLPKDKDLSKFFGTVGKPTTSQVDKDLDPAISLYFDAQHELTSSNDEQPISAQTVVQLILAFLFRENTFLESFAMPQIPSVFLKNFEVLLLDLEGKEANKLWSLQEHFKGRPEKRHELIHFIVLRHGYVEKLKKGEKPRQEESVWSLLFLAHGPALRAYYGREEGMAWSCDSSFDSKVRRWFQTDCGNVPIKETPDEIDERLKKKKGSSDKPKIKSWKWDDDKLHNSWMRTRIDFSAPNANKVTLPHRDSKNLTWPRLRTYLPNYFDATSEKELKALKKILEQDQCYTGKKVESCCNNSGITAALNIATIVRGFNWSEAQGLCEPLLDPQEKDLRHPRRVNYAVWLAQTYVAGAPTPNTLAEKRTGDSTLTPGGDAPSHRTKRGREAEDEPQ